jgi:hypothetical protein
MLLPNPHYVIIHQSSYHSTLCNEDCESVKKITLFPPHTYNCYLVPLRDIRPREWVPLLVRNVCHAADHSVLLHQWVTKNLEAGFPGRYQLPGIISYCWELLYDNYPVAAFSGRKEQHIIQRPPKKIIRGREMLLKRRHLHLAC